MNNIEILKQNNQSIWIDYISKEIIESGELKSLVNKGVTGLTSNPSIFEKAISQSESYDRDIKFLAENNPSISSYEVFEILSITDIKNAADLLLQTYDLADKRDGYVSIEVSPDLAHDTDKTINQAIHLHKKINMPNILIKVPATKEGVKAIQELTEIGINTNATLMFNQEHYRSVADAFINGCSKHNENKFPFSVASFFVSRVDTAIDKLISNKDNKSSLLGEIAILNSRLAYANFLNKFPNQISGPLQKPLWGSTSTKNSDYSKTLYIDKLIAPNSINTIPYETIEEFINTGNPENYNKWDKKSIEIKLEKLKDYDINLNQITQKLQYEGIKLFQESYTNLLKSITEKLKIISKNR